MPDRVSYTLKLLFMREVDSTHHSFLVHTKILLLTISSPLSLTGAILFSLETLCQTLVSQFVSKGEIIVGSSGEALRPPGEGTTST